MRFFEKVPLLVWALIVSVLILVAGVWFMTQSNFGKAQDSQKPVPVSTPVEGTQEFEIAGRQHIAGSAKAQDYNSNPPTSGQHWDSPAAKGIYDEPLPDERVVHDLEHGYVWISYRPAASDEVKNKLKEIVNEDDWKVIMTPREANDSKIALVAWGRLLKMEELNENKVRDFIKTYRNRGPENTPE